MKRAILQILFFFQFGILLMGTETPFSNYVLFNIGRSKDANEIYYYINLNQYGKLNESNPISIFWINRTNGNKREPLTWIQNKYSYGLNFLTKTSASAQFQFVSLRKRTFVLKKNSKGTFSVFTISGKKEVEVNRIFIQIDGGTFWFPKISKVELHATMPGTNIKIIETIRP